MDVRLKLDCTGVRISLDLWLKFSFEERMVLCHLPVDTEEEKRAFVSYLDFLSRNYAGTPADMMPPLDNRAWNDPEVVPASVAEKSAARSTAVTPGEWQIWQPHARYALYKSSISTRDVDAFFAILSQLRAGQK
jgi:hypothetical protein